MDAPTAPQQTVQHHTPSIHSIDSDNRLYTFLEMLDYEGPIKNLQTPKDEVVVYTIHPTWCNWNAVWAQQPYTFSPEEPPAVSVEMEFTNNALYRIYPEFSYQLLDTPIIYQGMTFSVSPKSNNPNIRHIVEWCMRKDRKYAYLTLVGVTATGVPIPFDDSEFPTFILAVPQHLSTVPFYPTHFISPIKCAKKLDEDRRKGRSQFSLEGEEDTTRWTMIVKSTSRIIKKIRSLFKK